MKTKTSLMTIGITLATLASAPLFAENNWEGEARDAWIDGKLESSYLLNTELNNFKIDTDVENGAVTLTGMVPSAVHKQLAEEIAANLDGVTTVNNELAVGNDKYERDANSRNFSTAFYDMTTTARLKSNYALNDDLKATDINIDTKDGVVVLEGEVKSSAAKQLAEEIAANYDHVIRVDNRLMVSQ